MFHVNGTVIGLRNIFFVKKIYIFFITTDGN